MGNTYSDNDYDFVDDDSQHDHDWRKADKSPLGDKKRQAVLRRQQKLERFRQKTDLRRLTAEAG